MSKQQKLIDEGEIAADYLNSSSIFSTSTAILTLMWRVTALPSALTAVTTWICWWVVMGRCWRPCKPSLVLPQKFPVNAPLDAPILPAGVPTAATFLSTCPGGRRRVQETGTPVELEPMSPFERKAVHDTIAEIAGVITESTGEVRIVT